MALATLLQPVCISRVNSDILKGNFRVYWLVRGVTSSDFVTMNAFKVMPRTINEKVLLFSFLAREFFPLMDAGYVRRV